MPMLEDGRPFWRILVVAVTVIALQHAGTKSKGHRPGQAHNPLELYRVENVRVAALNGASIKCNVTSIAGTHQWVEVTWSGLPAGAYDDYIALYPAGADPTKVAPIKYRWAALSPTHMVLGAGSTTFRVLNMRQDMRFALVRNGLQFPLIAAWSNMVAVEHPNHPMQGHLSLTGKPGEVRVQWVTRDAGKPQVRWGTRSMAHAAGRAHAKPQAHHGASSKGSKGSKGANSPDGGYDHSAAGDSRTYTRADMCGPPANTSGWMEPGWLHGGVMTGLKPSTRYYYQYGDEELGWSPEESFVSPPSVGRDAPVQLLAVADLGQAEEDGSMEASEMIPSLWTTRRMVEREPGAQLLVHNGDISYARGFGSQWDRYFEQMGPLLRRMPYMTTVGNHERDWPNSGDRFPAQYDSGGECGVPYYRRTRMPTAEEDKHWFSFDFGPIHFLQYSTEHKFEPGSEQYDFIVADLAAVNRTRTPWLIVGGHRPMYIDSTFYGLVPDGDQFVAKQLRGALEELLYRYQVDATWHGHHHTYQRTCPVFRGKCLADAADGTASGPVHLVIGHAGAGITPNIHFFRPRIFTKVHLKHGYMRVTANATHMRHEMLSSYDGAVLDDFMLYKPASWRFEPRPATVGRGDGAAGHAGRLLGGTAFA